MERLAEKRLNFRLKQTQTTQEEEKKKIAADNSVGTIFLFTADQLGVSKRKCSYQTDTGKAVQAGLCVSTGKPRAVSVLNHLEFYSMVESILIT